MWMARDHMMQKKKKKIKGFGFELQFHRFGNDVM